MINTLSLPEKKIKGTWHPKTIKNIILNKYDDQLPFIFPTFNKTFSSNCDPKTKTPSMPIVKYIRVVDPRA